MHNLFIGQIWTWVLKEGNGEVNGGYLAVLCLGSWEGKSKQWGMEFETTPPMVSAARIFQLTFKKQIWHSHLSRGFETLMYIFFLHYPQNIGGYLSKMGKGQKRAVCSVFSALIKYHLPLPLYCIMTTPPCLFWITITLTFSHCPFSCDASCKEGDMYPLGASKYESSHWSDTWMKIWM